MQLSTSQIRSAVVSTTLSLALAAAASGCGGGVSQSSYDKVQTGMTQEQVEGILGTDKEKTAADMGTPGVSVGGMTVPGTSAKVVTWTDGSKTITISFKDGKVFSKAENGL